jgi:hypothetical protein
MSINTGLPVCDVALGDKPTPESKTKCIAEVTRLIVTDASLQELREEYRRLKKAYTPLNLLMERARDIPLESVWPGRVASSSMSYGPRKEDLQELVKDAVDKAMLGRK